MCPRARRSDARPPQLVTAESLNSESRRGVLSWCAEIPDSSARKTQVLAHARPRAVTSNANRVSESDVELTFSVRMIDKNEIESARSSIHTAHAAEIPAGAPRSTLQIKAPRCLNPANA